jgi:hypothetical protein
MAALPARVTGNPRVKLTHDKVRKLRALRADGLTYRELAADSASAICQPARLSIARRGRTYLDLSSAAEAAASAPRHFQAILAAERLGQLTRVARPRPDSGGLLERYCTGSPADSPTNLPTRRVAACLVPRYTERDYAAPAFTESRKRRFSTLLSTKEAE